MPNCGPNGCDVLGEENLTDHYSPLIPGMEIKLITPEENKLFHLIELDTMTGWRRALDNYNNNPWTKTFTKEEAEESKKWREKNIVGRYQYRIQDSLVGVDEC